MDQDRQFLRLCEYSTRCVILVLVTIILMAVTLSGLPFLTDQLQVAGQNKENVPIKNVAELPSMWAPPDSLAIPQTPEGDLIRYGRELVAHTAFYLGPKGKVMQVSNGMNCQNCHLKAGKKVFGNNYSAVSSNYPKFRARSALLKRLRNESMIASNVV